MVSLKKYKNKKVAIYGMGITGQSAAKTFKRLESKVYFWDDSKKIRKKFEKINYNVKKFWQDEFLIDYILISPGIDINKCNIKDYLKKNSNKIITDLDLFFELNKDVLIISITGTNGKSTTCKLIEKILKVAKLNVITVGNIGRPILFARKLKKKSILILEVSSYQLEYSKLFRSKHAAILNVSPDHLERHKNMKNYAKIKSRIFFQQRDSDYTYLSLKNKYSKFIQKIFKNKKIKSKLSIVNKYSSNILLKKISNQYFRSEGNIENLLFAYKIAKNLRINDRIIIKAVNQFKGLSHRQEIILSNKNLLCVNDSKATSFEASLQSLLNYNKIYWIVGGLPKHQDNFNLKQVKKKIIKAYIIGKNSSFFKKQIKKDIKYTISNNIKRAVNDIYKDLQFKQNTKSTILLSPAAASFDQFSNFENRGLRFKNLIAQKFKSRLNA